MSNEIQQEKIRERAYIFFLERGQEDGSALEDWVRAEKEVTGGLNLSVAPKSGKPQGDFPEVHKRPSESRQNNSSVRRKY